MGVWLSSRGRGLRGQPLGTKLPLRPWALALLAGLCLAVALPRAASACSAVWLQTVALQQVAEVPACLALSQAQQVIDTGDPTSPGDMNRRAAVRVQSTCDEAYTIGCDGCVELELPARASYAIDAPESVSLTIPPEALRSNASLVAPTIVVAALSLRSAVIFLPASFCIELFLRSRSSR